LHAFVLMPDHFHVLITPALDVALEKAMQFIKGGFSFRLKSKPDVWMRSFNESQIMSEEKFVSCVRYIEENPVRRGLVSTPQAYPFSSAACAFVDTRSPFAFELIPASLLRYTALTISTLGLVFLESRTTHSCPGSLRALELREQNGALDVQTFHCKTSLRGDLCSVCRMGRQMHPSAAPINTPAGPGD